MDSIHLAYIGTLLDQAQEQVRPIVTDDIYRTHALQALLYDELPSLLQAVRELKYPAVTYAEEVVAVRRQMARRSPRRARFQPRSAS